MGFNPTLVWVDRVRHIPWCDGQEAQVFRSDRLAAESSLTQNPQPYPSNPIPYQIYWQPIFCFMQELPASFGQLSSLQKLMLDGCKRLVVRTHFGLIYLFGAAWVIP